ncbi:hypothetical protein A3Q36_05975 [Geobacillus stearothermophilus]|nr:hypothetical protein A3Q36_05975 [Geobacillus stearothermophilus]
MVHDYERGIFRDQRECMKGEFIDDDDTRLRIDSTIQVHPLSFYSDISFIHSLGILVGLR